MKVENIIHIGDVFRESSRHAEDFFYELIDTPIKIALGIDLDSAPFPSFRNSTDRFDLTKFFELTQGQDWVRNYHKIPIDAENYLFGSIPNNCLVIGYEIPPWLAIPLRRRNINYIDFRISPIRFSRDMYMALESNIPGFYEIINDSAVSKEEIQLEASLVKAQVRHNEILDRTRSYPKAQKRIIFVGQTEMDASLMSDDGERLTIEHFKEKLTNLTADIEISYKPHPYARSFAKKEKKKLQEIIGKKISIERSSIYSLLGSSHDCELLTISSGVSQEAIYFGKRSHTLFRSLCNIDKNNLRRPLYMQIRFWDFISPRLWASLFERDSKMLPVDALPQTPANTMRHLYNAWWGYDRHIFAEDFFWRKSMRESLSANAREYLRKLTFLIFGGAR